jgi:hypothetical protein
MIPCDICSKQGHSWFDCPKRSTMPIGWKPDRLKKTRGGSLEVRAGRNEKPDAGSNPAPRSKNTPRGSGTARKAPGGSAPRKSIAEPERAPGISSEVKPATDLLPVRATQQGTQSAPIPIKRGRGRPKSIKDMRAYKAAKAKEYRAAKDKPNDP